MSFELSPYPPFELGMGVRNSKLKTKNSKLI